MVQYTISLKIVSEYDQEIPQSQTADNPVAPQGRAAQPSRYCVVIFIESLSVSMSNSKKPRYPF